jgi:hypothetical protein
LDLLLNIIRIFEAILFELLKILPKTFENLVKDEYGNLLARSHILSSRKNYFPYILNAHWGGHSRQMEIHATEPRGPEHCESEIAIANVERIKSSDVDEISAELIQARGKILF